MLDLQITPATALELGWSIVPTGPDKTPYFPWKQYQTDAADEDLVISWLADTRAHYFARITGEKWQVICLDFDGDAGNRTLSELGLDPHVRTRSGGHHVYVTHPGWLVPTRNAKTTKALGKASPGLDIKGDRNGYACFWHTGRATGHYTWLRSPEPVSWSELERVPRFVELLPFLKEREAPPAPVSNAAESNHSPEATTKAAKRYLGRAIASNNTRHTGGFVLACLLRDLRLSAGEAQIYLLRYQAAVEFRKKSRRYTHDEALKAVSDAYDKPARANPLDWRDPEYVRISEAATIYSQTVSERLKTMLAGVR